MRALRCSALPAAAPTRRMRSIAQKRLTAVGREVAR
jgi:hypothetical protein